MDKLRIATLEEHYVDVEVAARLGATRPSPLIGKLEDFTSVRLQEMDDAGIDFQIISHAPPGLQAIADDAAGLARRANDRLHAAVMANPARFAALASLPTADPQAAADELERAVTRLGFKGGIVHGLTGGLFIDEKKFWPVFARAAALDVPIYIHPSEPHPDVVRSYYGSYAASHPMFIRAAWGYTVETGTQAIRLVLSGVFDAHPNLKIILGHLGETIPFLLARIDEALSRDTPMKEFRKVFCRHFYVTTSGFFSDPALLCCIQELGADRILFSVDWPFASNRTGADWIRRVSLSEEDKRKICYGNAQRLLKLEW